MDVMIDMTSVQIVNEDRTVTELVTEGVYRMEGDTAHISYEDSEATGFEGSVTELEVQGERLASIRRSGTATSNLVIESNKKHYCHYAMPFGEMVIGVYTHAIRNRLMTGGWDRLTPEGGELFLRYTIDMNGSYLSDNEIRLSVRKA